MTTAEIDQWFTHHAPTPDQVEQLQAIRAAGRHLAMVIHSNTPASADQSAAVRLVREAVMTANAAIVCQIPAAAALTPKR